mgnify:CR=1 FL=1
MAHNVTILTQPAREFARAPGVGSSRRRSRGIKRGRHAETEAVKIASAKETSPSVTENNQFLDPPIVPQDRTDEPRSAANGNFDSANGDIPVEEMKQNEGYRSICRE